MLGASGGDVEPTGDGSGDQRLAPLGEEGELLRQRSSQLLVCGGSSIKLGHGIVLYFDIRKREALRSQLLPSQMRDRKSVV